MKRLFGFALVLAFMFTGIATVSAWEYISADDAYVMLENDNTYLLDVRTPCEWHFVGHSGAVKDCNCTANPDCEGCFLEGKVIHIPFWLWEFDPETKEYVYIRYSKFFDENVVRQFDADDTTIILMCKSDGRGGYASTELENPTHPAFQRLELKCCSKISPSPFNFLK